MKTSKSYLKDVEFASRCCLSVWGPLFFPPIPGDTLILKNLGSHQKVTNSKILTLILPTRVPTLAELSEISQKHCHSPSTIQSLSNGVFIMTPFYTTKTRCSHRDIPAVLFMVKHQWHTCSCSWYQTLSRCFEYRSPSSWPPFPFSDVHDHLQTHIEHGARV